MALPITIPYTFANATSSIPLSQLDSDFTTVSNAINGIGNGINSLSNVSITGGSVTATTTLQFSGSLGNVYFSSAGDTLVFTKAGTNYVSASSAGGNFVFQVNAGTTALSLRSNGNAELSTLVLTNAPGTLSCGNQTAVKGGVMRQDWLIEAGANASKNEGGIWPNGSVYAYFTAAQTFTSSNSTQDGESPNISGFFVAYANGTDKDVVGSIPMAVALSTGVSVFGANPIARSNSGIGNAKHVGMEVDTEVASGVTAASGSAGIYINSFNYDGCGSAIQTGGIGGGTFTNGVVINGINSQGAAFTDQSGLSCKYGLFLGNGSYSNSAIYLANLYNMRFGTGTNVYGDTGGYLNVKLTSGALFDASTSTENSLNSAFRNSSSTSSVQIFTASGSSWNGAAAAMTVAKNNTTSRSINAAGTINASGADYAEYELKRDDCATVQKGNIIGFDVDGKITDQWSLAVSFGVKTTNPNLVGGDVWHLAAGEMPVEPTYVAPELQKPEYPAQSIHVKSDVTIEQHEAEMAQYKAALAAHRAEWDSTVYADYMSLKVEYEQRLEVERQKVDRIAYCGKVPVNVTGANVGDYIVPVEQSGKIGGVAVSAPSFDQYIIAVGRVRKIMADGRPEIVVKPI